MSMSETLRARLTMWYVGALGIALIAFAALLYVWLSRTLYQHHDHELLASADRVARLLQPVALDQDSIARAVASIDTPPRLLMVRDQTGRLLYRSPVLQVAEPTIGEHSALIHAAANASREPEFFTVALERSGPVRFICTPVDRSPAAYVQIGNELGDVPSTMRAVGVASMVLVPLVILLTSFGGWLIAGRALAPIGSIDTTLRAIEATDLSRRVEVHPPDRELSALVGTINGLLARLEHAFQDLRDFTADASHQLQTPLTIMKSSIEFTRASPAQMTTALLDDLEEEVDDMSSVVAELQSLSLADADAQESNRTDVDLSELCVDAAEILKALGESRDVAVEAEVAPDVTCCGDAAKLKQVVLNLGDNAIKYTPAGGRVTVRLLREEGLAVLQVTDTGVGISPEHLPHVFDRFFRGRAGDTDTRGSGLGLAIAKRIVEVHRGTIHAASHSGSGTTIDVKLPI
jgi:signal transduction histidine kinase